jgi:predicted dehydrogenase
MKRRDFIVKGGVISTAVLASSSAFSSLAVNPGNDSNINIGVIGTGSRGGGLIPFLKEIEGMTVTACCDVLPFRLESGLERAGQKARGYADYRKLLDNPDIDAVLVSTPFNTHAQIAIHALEAGKHVYCEKTLAKGFNDIAKLVDKASATKTIFQTGHQYHSSRLYEHVVGMIRDGEIGKIIAFECQWNRNGDWRRSVPDPKWERAINWRLYREYSGGLTAELCSHQIDFINWVLEENPSKIMGIGGIDYWRDGRETYDNIHLLFEYPGGVKASFTCLTSNALGDYQIKVLGDKGTILLDYTKAWIYHEKGFTKKLEDVDGVTGATVNPHLQGQAVPIEVSHIDPSKQALIDFRNSVLDNKLPVSNVYTGANTATAVQLSLDAMDQQEAQYWNSGYSSP